MKQAQLDASDTDSRAAARSLHHPLRRYPALEDDEGQLREFSREEVGAESAHPPDIGPEVMGEGNEE